jgi:hypothetical protein
MRWAGQRRAPSGFVAGAVVVASAAALGGCSTPGEADRAAVERVRWAATYDRDVLQDLLVNGDVAPGTDAVGERLLDGGRAELLETVETDGGTIYRVTYLDGAQTGGFPSSDATARLCVDVVVTEDADVTLEDADCPHALRDEPVGVIVTDLGL